MQRAQQLLRSIASGTLLGLFGPCVLYLVYVFKPGGGPADDVLRELVVLLLVCGVPGCICAIIGGMAAALSDSEASWPESLLTVIVVVLWLVLVMMVARVGVQGFELMFITALTANAGVSGWYAIKVVRQTRRDERPQQAGEPPRLTPELERVARARFVTNATSEGKEAIRAEPQGLAEPPGPA